MRLLPLRTLSVTLVAAGLLVGGPALAASAADYEMPFPCGQAWTGNSRSSHSPSPYAIDWNRADDIGDPVVASAAGTVSVADSVDNGGYGRYVVLEHGSGESTLYAHLSTVGVRVGQAVAQGGTLGTVGSTGRSTGPHLHFEERVDRRVVAPVFSGVRFAFGSTLTSRNCANTDVPIAGRFGTRRAANVGVYHRGRPSQFRVRRHSDGGTTVLSFGTPQHEPVVGDWDGNGRVNVGVRNPANGLFSLRTKAKITRIAFGRSTDIGIAGDWDGNGRFEVGLRRPGTATFYQRAANGSYRAVRLGDADDLPVTGDWNGDKVTDLGVYDSATARFTLRITDAEGLAWFAVVPFGTAGDLPVAGDWDGNGRTDLGVWDPDTARFSLRHAPAPTKAARRLTTLDYGLAR